MESLERFVFDKRTSFEMLGIKPAFEIAIALLSAPDPFGVTAKMADSFYPGDVATIFMVIPPALEIIKHAENLSDRDDNALTNRALALAKVIKRDKGVQRYFDQAQLMSDGALQRLIGGYLELNGSFQQYAYVLNHREMLSPSVDFYLANMAFHAHMNDDSGAENHFQRTRYELTKGRN